MTTDGGGWTVRTFNQFVLKALNTLTVKAQFLLVDNLNAIPSEKSENSFLLR